MSGLIIMLKAVGITIAVVLAITVLIFTCILFISTIEATGKIIQERKKR